ncbi:transaldolase [Candidatus Gottesmanbacteria bacterium]|nr:transaldolase [Candidatus Gottesmanbacteria bacterium]
MNFPSKIFIDGGDPEETKAADVMLKKAGYHGLDGQTTNPSLIAKNFASTRPGTRVAMQETLNEYKRIVQKMSAMIPSGQISIQVIGDPATLTVEEMLSQARDRIRWIPNGVIKFPTTKTGLKAAEVFCREGPVNMTLAFSQEQAAAVYSATKAHKGDVFVSPFVGRLDDRGENGMDVIVNIVEMYRKLGDAHVQVLAASIRTVKHILYALKLKSDVITIPFKVFNEWAAQGFPQPSGDFIYDMPGLTEIPYRELTLDNEWTEYDLYHALTDAGLAKFWEDWQSIVSA